MPAFASSAAMIAFVPPLADTLISFASGTPASASCVPYPLAGAEPLQKGKSGPGGGEISAVGAVAGENPLAPRLLRDAGAVGAPRREPQSLAARELPLLARRAHQR